jgi:hypothetical protein
MLQGIFQGEINNVIVNYVSNVVLLQNMKIKLWLQAKFFYKKMKTLMNYKLQRFKNHKKKLKYCNTLANSTHDC